MSCVKVVQKISPCAWVAESKMFSTESAWVVLSHPWLTTQWNVTCSQHWIYAAYKGWTVKTLSSISRSGHQGHPQSVLKVPRALCSFTNGDCMDLTQVLCFCVMVVNLVMCGNPNTGRKYGSDSFAWSWCSFLPIGLPWTAPKWELSTCLLYLVLFCLALLSLQPALL